MRLPPTPSQPASQRRALLQFAAVAALTSLAPTPTARAISATTMSGKSKPELGVILVEAPKVAGGQVAAEIVLDGGQVATIGFAPDPNWELQDGGYYDVETRSRDGDNAFVQVVALPKGQALGSLKSSWFTKQVLGVEGRYGSYGAPIDIKVLSDTMVGSARSIDVSFSALSPGAAEVPRRAVLTAFDSGSDVIMLVSGTSGSRWKKGGEAAARKASSSFRVVSTRPSALKQEPSADFRYGRTSGPSTMSSRNDGF